MRFRLEILLATALPGAYKALLFFALQRRFGLGTLGDIASWQSTAQIIGYFTAVGWSSLILIRVPKQISNQAMAEEFVRISAMAILSLAVLLTVLIIAARPLNLSAEIREISFWLCAWTIYQLPRHFYLATRNYLPVILLDCLIIFISLWVIEVSNSTNASANTALAMLAIGIAYATKICRRLPNGMGRLKYDPKGIEFGAANLFSGGIALCIIPIARITAGNDVAGVTSIILTIAGIAQLFPRAIALNQLPILAKSLVNKTEGLAILERMRRLIHLSNYISSTVCLFLCIGAAWAIPHSLSNTYFICLSILISAQGFIGTLSLANSNFLMALERSRELIKVNGLVFFLFAVGATFFYLSLINGTFLAICALTCVLAASRNILVRNLVKVS